ncbi:MAG: amidohydrolase family protein [Rhodoferax sp.]|jgi:imidazolonepropionase-like amidohydrolase|nr:amidohydrolase family protein [Rhodoferax sp.]
MSAALLFENARVIDGTGAAPFQSSVLVEGDRIAALGADALARVAHLQHAQRRDLQGQTLMPGLIDAHCHLSFDDAASNPEIFHQRRNALSALVAAYNARKLLRAGVTGLLDPDSVFENMVDVRDAAEAGIIQAPRIACGCYAIITAVGGTAGRLIADTGITGYYKSVQGRDEIIAEVRRQVKVGADWIKVHVSGVVPRYAHRGEQCSWTQEELSLICEVAHDLGVPVMGHCRGNLSAQRAVRAGVDLIFHGTGMDEATTDAVIERRIPVCPAFTFQANMVDYGHRLGTDDALVQLFQREIADSAASMRRLHEAGVPLLCGSEAGFSMVPYGHWHYREMEVFTRYYGLSNLQAIHCATGAGAFALKMAGQTGVVAAGMKADLLVVDGDPSQDVRVLGEPGRIREVFVDGRAMDISEPPPRRPLGGWRMPSMGRQLTRDFALRGVDAAGQDAPLIEEL